MGAFMVICPNFNILLRLQDNVVWFHSSSTYIYHLPVSTVLDVLPSFSNISCFVHLYVEILQFLIVSIFDCCAFITVGSPFCVGLMGVVGTVDGAEIQRTSQFQHS